MFNSYIKVSIIISAAIISGCGHYIKPPTANTPTANTPTYPVRPRNPIQRPPTTPQHNVNRPVSTGRPIVNNPSFDDTISEPVVIQNSQNGGSATPRPRPSSKNEVRPRANCHVHPSNQTTNTTEHCHPYNDRKHQHR